nr:MAG TPA: hypothetical protein [Podoviridae sp. ctJ6o53]
MDAMEVTGKLYSMLNGKNRVRVVKEVYTLLEEQQRQNIKSFDYNGQEVRTVEMNGQPWFVAVDVCNVLEIGNSRMAVDRLDEDEKNTVSLTDGNKRGNPNMTIVSESGLYSLILGSRKPEAKQFKRWITHEVIPSIRKTGGYIAGQETLSPEELMAKALLVAKQTLAERDARINELSCANSELTVQNQILLPRAQYFDELVDRNLLTNFRETAKELGIAPKRFVNWLIEQKYIYRDKKGKLLPYEGKNTGLFELKEQFNPKTEWSGVQTLVTPKGRETFRLLCTAL